MLWLINACYLVAGSAYLPRLLYEMIVLKKNRRGWRERLGHLKYLDPASPRIWIHAVSLGEMNATQTLVRELRAARPDCDIVFSTTTDTGYARGRELYPDHYVFRFPLDLSWVIRRALDRLRVNLIVLVELEVWHNLVRLAELGGIPVAVFNGRLSEKSVRRFGWVRRLVRPMFARLFWVGAQDETYARRFRALGVSPERVRVTGSVKFDTAPAETSVPGTEQLAREMGLGRDEPLWVCGSTGPGEEEIILNAHGELLRTHPKLRLAIIPRKPERFDDVARMIRRSGLACVRRSDPHRARTDSESGMDTLPVLLGDTMGELRKFYSLCTVAFVGRSLVPMGGSDVIEVAAMGKPILVGPHTQNFTDIVEQMKQHEALLLTNAGSLASAVARLLSDTGLANRLGENGLAVVRANIGATARSLEGLLPLLGRSIPSEEAPGK